MKKWITIFCCMAMLGCMVSDSFAGEYADKLTSCLLDSATKKDKLVLVKWVGFAISRHEAVATTMSVSDLEMVQASKEVGDLLIYLMGDVCREFTEQAIQHEGPAAIQQSFHVLGQAASYEMFADPDVQQGMTHVGKYLQDNFPKEFQ